MIFVNVRKSVPPGASPEDLREGASGDWANISESSLETFADHLAAVRQNVVLGVWPIEGHRRLPDGRVRFELGDSDAHKDLVGQPSPAVWVRGAANPVKFLETETMLPESAEVETTPQGNRRVGLDGWSLIVYDDGRARLQAPDSDLKLFVESAFPDPKGGNVTVRLVKL